MKAVDELQLMWNHEHVRRGWWKENMIYYIFYKYKLVQQYLAVCTHTSLVLSSGFGIPSCHVYIVGESGSIKCSPI